MRIRTLEVSGMRVSTKAIELSYDGEVDLFDAPKKNLAGKLSSCQIGTGHDSFLKGITVLAEITAPHDWILQFYRYSFRDTVSSSSKMHSIAKAGSIRGNCSKYVNKGVIAIVDSLVREYDRTGLAEDYEKLIASTPLGYELRFVEVLSYLQIKTMYAQRKNHKMQSWNTVFSEWVKTLPNSELITD